MNFVIKHKLTIAGVIIGAIVGFLYYHFEGCSGGTCPLTSKPLNSTFYGAIMGGFLVYTFKK